MKYVLVLLVVVGGLWLLLRGRGRATSGRRGKSPAGAAPMVACAHCGIHLPRDDAVIGASGQPYCSDAHRLAGPR